MHYHGFSRRIIRQLKNSYDDISLNGVHIRMIDFLHEGDLLCIILREQTWVLSNDELFAPIIYEDDDVIVYNKPPFMPVHPSGAHQLDTLANVYCSHMEKQGIISVFHPVNRLDRDTCGLCVAAKNQLAASIMNKGIQKIYTAVACGNVTPTVGRIVAPIDKMPENTVKRRIAESGKFAATNYEVIKKTQKYSLLKIKLETGRTHQIRLHFAYIGFPLAGDSLYGGDMSDINRQALCCTQVKFIRPMTKEPITLTVPIPNDMQSLL